MNPPSFKSYIFISYAHLDNQPLSKGKGGYVSLLHERLSLRVGQLLGDKNIRIWRDKKLEATVMWPGAGFLYSRGD
jgi:hypothetical protein